MSKSHGSDIVGQLKAAIRTADLTIYRIAKDSGVDYSTIYRFVSGERSMDFDSAARIATYLGLELRPIRKGR